MQQQSEKQEKDHFSLVSCAKLPSGWQSPGRSN
jgi:hypothetical protein